MPKHQVHLASAPSTKVIAESNANGKYKACSLGRSLGSGASR